MAQTSKDENPDRQPTSTQSVPTKSSDLRERLSALVLALRPRQWTKNLAVFVAIIFAQRLFDLASFERAILAFIAFCLASSSIYLLNDLLDIDRDRQHPVKRLRPLASGRLPISWAIAAMSVLILGCITLILFLFNIPIAPVNATIYADLGGANFLFALTVALYLMIMVLYSIRLKHIVLIDVFIIAGGFVLRIIAGAVVIPVSISPWLGMVTCLLSLFLALSKRRHELTLLQGEASQHRQILKEYSIPMLDQMITIVVAATVVAYSLYTVQSPTGHHRLILTVPLVLYGIFRYLYLVYMRMEGGSPEEILLRDRHMLGTVILCTILIITVLYILP
ncbi:decaprenyl-phosphate phosphoribosyltransferase [Ktedonosporobacter rubrisoli]|uniref:Decaprenyl-phosphate phosphoribosyltransferase n=1 Tax=Ktedonosporobacter rubrisoli TaxID=2509675 RepID=A0A4P6K5N7_KTERU|nr:decaprenyl-phosphate phosphoribosyltransferase [Ktedonosporobacter rubrisoli]